MQVARSGNLLAGICIVMVCFRGSERRFCFGRGSEIFSMFWPSLYPKRNRRPEPLKHTKDPYLDVFNLDFFRLYETFFAKFSIK